MAIKFANDAETVLAGGISATATSLTVSGGKGALFPALSGLDYFYVTLVRKADGLNEIVKVTARSTDVFTIVREQDNTSGKIFALGDFVSLRMNAASLETFINADDDVNQVASSINGTVHTEAAHATTSDIWTGGNTCLLSGGAVTFTDVADAPQAGAVRYVVANAAHVITDNAALEVDGNANYTCAANDVLMFTAKTTSTFRVNLLAHGDTTGDYVPSAVAITGGTINGTTIGASTPAAGDFTTLDATGEVTGAGFTGTLDGVLGGGTPAAATTTTLASTTITASGILKTDDTTEATSTTDGSLQTDGGLSVAKDVVAGNDVKLLSDASILSFGADGDVTLAHVADTGLLLNSTMAIQFNDASQFIKGSSNAILDLGATDKIGLTATLIETNGNQTISGTTLTTGVATHGDDVVSDTDSTDDLGTTDVRWANLFVDGITATDQVTATGFTGTLDGILGSGTPAAASVTTVTATGDITMTGKSVNEAVHTEAAHATTSDIWTGGNTCLLSGSAVTFTDVADAPQAGASRMVVANAAHVITDNAALEVDGNADYTCAVGDLLRFEAKTTSTFRVSVMAHGDGAGSGDAKTANPLSQFAATTSAQLAGVISNETGSGLLVFGTSPTLVTPALGTPSALVGTNISGTAASLTAGNVTTNANLTGHITSSGNAAVLGSFTSAQLATALTNETGSGAAVFAESPTLVTPALGTPASGVATNLTGTASGLTAGNVTTNANLTGHITSSGNAAVLGSFTSAQLKAALTNETGSGAAVFAESPTLVTPALGTPASGTLTNCTFPTLNQSTTGNATTATTATNVAGGAGGSIPYQSSANTTALLSNGSDGQVLTSAGGTSAPAWENPAGGGDALTSNPLSQFAATTSAQLRGVLSDETGSGAAVFATSPTLTGVATMRSEIDESSAYTGQLVIDSVTKSAGHLARILFEHDDHGSASIASDYESSGYGNLILSTRGGGDPTERMRIKGDGKVGIGTAAPIAKLTTDSGDIAISSTVTSDDGDLGEFQFWNRTNAGSGSGTSFVNDVAAIQGKMEGTGNNSGGSLHFYTKPDGDAKTEKMTIDGAGKVGINKAAPVTQVHIEGGGTSLPATTGTTPSAGTVLRIRPGNNAILDIGGNSTSGAWLQSYDQTGMQTEYPLLLNPNGGNVGIGTASPLANTHIFGSGTAVVASGSDGRAEAIIEGANIALTSSYGNLNVISNTAQAADTGGQIAFAGKSTDSSNAYATWGVIKGAKENATSANIASYLAFSTRANGGGNTEKLRITSSGTIQIGVATTNSSASSLTLKVASGGATGVAAQIASDSGTSYPWSNYNTSGTYVGGITCTSSATAFATSSDVRLKKDIKDAPSAVEKIKAARVVSHEWKEEDTAPVEFGFVAQELIKVVPQAVIEGKDKEDGGIEIPWGVDYSKLVPLLVKTIQELEARIAVLEAK